MGKERGRERERERERNAKLGGVCLLPAQASAVPAIVPASRIHTVMGERPTVALANALGCVPSGLLELRSPGPDRSEDH